MKRSIIALVLITAGGGIAHADRAKALFDQRCAGCHALGNGEEKTQQQKRFVDLTRAHGRRQEQQLREWITNPNKVQPNTNCEAGKLEPQEVDLLIALLKHRSHPHLERPYVPEAENQPPTPEKNMSRYQKGQVKR